MKLVIQRVTSANVTINSNIIAKIASGLVILLGIDPTDTQDDITWLVKKQLI
jgi:D-Tyr-tRNAtyr deacylase